MSSPFLFLPRTVSKPKKNPEATDSEKQSTPKPGHRLPRPELETSTSSSNRSSSHELSPEEYSILIHLALSDHALWSDPDLRQLIATSTSPSDGEKAFVPLRHILKRSKVLSPLQLVPFESVIAKAIRADTNHLLELRLLVLDPSSSKDVGSYEIRRKDWEIALNASYTKAFWDERTIYAERIPSQHKTLSTLVKFTSGLLTSAQDRQKVQGVIFPPHHRDKLGDQPSYKGFALFVLQDANDVESLLKSFPWSSTTINQPGGTEAIRKEASLYGFRTLSRSRWNELKEEYRAYKRRLVDEINIWNDSKAPAVTHQPKRPDPPPTRDEATPPASSSSSFNELSAFPPNTLAFIRNLHPETNKTTLRSLFSNALPAEDGKSTAIDYIDYTKGMDSCHLRLATPQHAQAIVDYFAQNRLVQQSGLDDSGISDPKSLITPSIVVELVSGRREELYWEKVPEKVRTQAIQKALVNMGGCTTGGYNMRGNSTNTPRKKRKR